MKRSKSARKISKGQGWALVDDAPGPAGETPGTDTPCGRPLARLRLERRRGKPVTVAAFEGLEEAERRALAKELKTLCGTGGTVKDTVIELQGDHRPVLRGDLAGRGLRVKG